MTRCTNHCARTLAAIALLSTFFRPAQALDAIVLEVRELTVAGVPVSGASVRLDLLSDDQARLTMKARELKLAAPAGSFSDVALTCDHPVIAEPHFGGHSALFSRVCAQCPTTRRPPIARRVQRRGWATLPNPIATSSRRSM